jgi:tRNA (guanosine-2'-O-)-methyltransferase
MTIDQLEAINAYFETFLTDNRIALIERNLSLRTRYLTLVLEDIYQTQNASAVIRSADCFGVQDIHVIENSNHFHVNRDVVRGASQWVTLHRYNQQSHNTVHALQQLKQNGYRIVATSPHKGGVSLQQFDIFKGKAAIVFGSEHGGISSQCMELADEFLYIPMVGFTESLNISVTAAIVMHHLMLELYASNIEWKLSSYEYQTLKYQWLKYSIKRPELIERAFFEQFIKK